MTPAFGGQYSIQLSYGCVKALLAAPDAKRQRAWHGYFLGGRTSSIGVNLPSPQLAPRMLPAVCISTVMISTLHN